MRSLPHRADRRLGRGCSSDHLGQSCPSLNRATSSTIAWMKRPLFALSIGLLVSFNVLACGGGSAPAASTASSAAAGSTALEPVFEAQAIGPLTEATPLQIVSMFSYEQDEKLLTPATEIGAFVSDARTKQGFGRDALKSMVVTPTPTTIKADKLSVIAWGPRSEFSIARIKEMGHEAMREALQLNVESFAYAPIARDQGVTTLAADDVAAAFVEGALTEFFAERRAAPSTAPQLKHVTYEAGAQFVEAVGKAVARGVDAARGHAS